MSSLFFTPLKGELWFYSEKDSSMKGTFKSNKHINLHVNNKKGTHVEYNSVSLWDIFSMYEPRGTFNSWFYGNDIGQDEF